MENAHGLWIALLLSRSLTLSRICWIAGLGPPTGSTLAIRRACGHVWNRFVLSACFSRRCREVHTFGTCIYLGSFFFVFLFYSSFRSGVNSAQLLDPFRRRSTPQTPGQQQPAHLNSVVFSSSGIVVYFLTSFPSLSACLSISGRCYFHNREGDISVIHMEAGAILVACRFRDCWMSIFASW